jgi:hypothetical protein
MAAAKRSRICQTAAPAAIRSTDSLAAQFILNPKVTVCTLAE